MFLSQVFEFWIPTSKPVRFRLDYYYFEFHSNSNDIRHLDSS